MATLSLVNAQIPDEMQRRSRSFDAWALDYDRYRPSYPDALFDHIAERLALGPEPVVADLGAGTGKATLAMARRGWHVTAVEPGQPMLDALAARAARDGLQVETRQAEAEANGLPDASVDLVTVAQAFHWFDKPRALAEMARIVRPGGGVAVFWNARADDRSRFLAAYTDLVARYVPEEHVDRREKRRESTAPEDLAAGGWFVVDDRVEIVHEVPMTHEEFVGYAFTASYIRLFLTADSAPQLRAELADLLAEHAPGGSVTVPYDVDLYIGRRT